MVIFNKLLQSFPISNIIEINKSTVILLKQLFTLLNKNFINYRFKVC